MKKNNTKKMIRMSREKMHSSLKDYSYIKPLGEGGYSKVFLMKNNKTNEKCALKVINRIINNKDKSSRIMAEIRVLMLCDHQNIIKLIDWFKTQEHFYLILEYIEGKDLKYYFRRENPEEPVAIHIIKQIANAIKYCHDRAIIHRDIKLANVLIDKKINIKLSDFGLCIIKEDQRELHTNDAGTARFKAPEIISGQPYNEAIDIWSFGILIYVLITGTYPFDGSNEQIINKKILSGEIPLHHPSLTSIQIDLLKNMLILDPHDRYTIDNIINHPWLTKSKDKTTRTKDKEICNQCKKHH